MAAVLGLVVLTACGGQSPEEVGETAQEAATELAAALSQGSLEEIPIHQGDPEEDLPVLLEGMNGMLPAVTVAHVSPSAQVANIKLAYRWPLSSPWTYESDAVLVRDGRDWELNWKPAVLHPKLTENTRLERQRGDASDRGNITGRGATVLVENRPHQMLGLDKAELDGDAVTDSARRVAEKAGIDQDAYVAKAHAAGADAFVDAVPVRQEDLPADFLAIPGAALRTVTIPAPPTKGYAQALLGSVGYATAEQAEDVDSGVAGGDLVGISGLQRSYDRQLRGNTGNRVFLADQDAPIGEGRPTRATLLADFPDVPGESLSTTIDAAIQTAAEDVLDDLEAPASVVVLQLGTGSIRAAADSPAARHGDESTRGRFSPGLGAAPVAALALLRSGVDLDENVPCEQEVTVDGRTFTNENSFRTTAQLSLARALSDGCRTAVAAAAERVDPAKLPEAAKSLGLEQTPDIGIPLDLGSFPAPGDPLARAEALTGAGDRGNVRANTLALATMAASVQAEEAVTPYVVPEREPKAENVVPLSDDEARTLQNILQTGSSSYRPLTGVATGTAGGREWAVGYTNDYAIAVMLDDPDATWRTPAQIMRTVLAAG